jgi:predicted nucleotidyltransferase
MAMPVSMDRSPELEGRAIAGSQECRSLRPQANLSHKRRSLLPQTNLSHKRRSLLPQANLPRPESPVLSATRRYFESRLEVREVVVFGSFANGRETRHSDLDLVVVKDTDQRFLDRCVNYLDLDREIGGTPVELFVYTPGEWQSMKTKALFSKSPTKTLLQR